MTCPAWTSSPGPQADKSTPSPMGKSSLPRAATQELGALLRALHTAVLTVC